MDTFTRPAEELGVVMNNDFFLSPESYAIQEKMSQFVRKDDVFFQRIRRCYDRTQTDANTVNVASLEGHWTAAVYAAFDWKVITD